MSINFLEALLGGLDAVLAFCQQARVLVEEELHVAVALRRHRDAQRRAAVHVDLAGRGERELLVNKRQQRRHPAAVVFFLLLCKLL